MSSLSIHAVLPEDQFKCSICLNVFSDPVTTPCGHNFCMACISEHWDNSELCQCPKCNKRFYARPEVSTNSVMEEISVQIKKRKLDVPECIAAAWEVTCDVCTEIKLKALKSCLVCLTSYCEAHLEPHQRVPSLMRHKLIDPVENLEERVCKKHERFLERFCRDEQLYVCVLCTETDHRNHDTVPVEEEGAQQKEKIESKIGEIQMMIEERMEKIEEITRSPEMGREIANKEMEDSNKLFTDLMSRVQSMQTTLQASIEEKLRSSQNKADAMIQELQEEITELQRRQSELEQLSQTEDNLHLLQTSQALCTHPATKDWSEIRVYSDVCVGMVRRAMSHLVNAFQAEQKTLTNMELNRMREFKESVTLDPNTASRYLSLSEGDTRVKMSKTANLVPDNPERFDRPMVLGKKGFNSGRHYWEVQVGLRNDWDVGVAKETVSRKGEVNVTRENGFFALEKSGFDYEVNNTPYKTLHLNPRPRKVGVYVDYEEGRVSFYDVNEKSHIYSFKGESFTEKLFPYFYVYSKAKKSEPLVLIGDCTAYLLTRIRSASKATE
ncbi:E3 ubiquitin-protein ligase TRIM39-like [Centroberyx gerrardi]|uniref:E3 ubiquitin-protein ligase TRIM39-like n=1 Tax=Centroberyx gerrardi TaxID=166262 RepID=UPI003AAE3DD9